MKRNVTVAMFSVVLILVSLNAGLPRAADEIRLAVHEWGTFTSIAGENGHAVPWRTYTTPDHLPCFVYRSGGSKGGFFGNVRMETPVIYFYGSHDLTANVKVLFPKGTITEWYPKADVPHASNLIEWRDVMISPNNAAFPHEAGSSHYYSARETDAVPVRVASQHEKFLFYRGVGNFPLPISAVVNGGKIRIKNLGFDLVQGVIVFDNRDGKRRYHLAGPLQNEMVVDLASLQSSWTGLPSYLIRILMAEGLYEKEARAMIETWRDSWFEEGTRVFYIIPKSVIESVLPLEIQPIPSQIARVFVGRMEIVTPDILNDVQQAVAHNDRVTLRKYGRFLEPIGDRLHVDRTFLDSIYWNSLSQNATCRQ